MSEPSALLSSLESLDCAHPLARKRLVGPDMSFGRELLLTLARRTNGWIGWEATNLREIAKELAFLPLAESGVRAADDVTVDALVGRALERAISARAVSAGFAALAPGLGFRRALLDSLLELRTAGVSVDELRAAALPGSPAHDLPAVLAEYERLLAESKLADAPALFRVAVEAFEHEAPFLLDGVIALVPSRPPRGLPGRLHELLVARGAVALAVDEVDADRVLHPATTADFFAAATPTDELRELGRRVIAEGLRWDDVEIVTTDADTYGIAFDALFQRIGVDVTMLQGIPLARTRAGRALHRWLEWLSDGLSADTLRQALEAGELASVASDVSSAELARELRSLKIGWGRARFDAALATLASGAYLKSVTPREDESDDEHAERRAARERTGGALAVFLQKLLAETPRVPARGDQTRVTSSSAELAKATLGFLELFRAEDGAEMQTVERLRDRLRLVAGLPAAEESFSSVLAALREALADLRAWPSVAGGRRLRSSSGGMPHLTTLSHAGTTGRRRVFVVGFDAERTSGSGRQDPILPDAIRRQLGAGRLVTSSDRRDETALAVASALAALRGRVTISWATSGTLDGREAGPSPLLLEAWRQMKGSASLSYDDLRAALAPPVSAVPARDESGALAGVVPLDARDVWLDALADGPLLLDGAQQVRDAYPVLAAGLDAHGIAQGNELTEHHGLVPHAAAALDPTSRPDREISPSSLETLGKCPLAWFYHYGLSLRASEDPEYDEERWLDPMQRGSLLHEVFEAFTRELQGRQAELRSEGARRRIGELASEIVARWRTDVPPPSETVFELERGEIMQSAYAFLQMERDQLSSSVDGGGRWHDFEVGFGRGRAPGRYELADGRTILTHGRADRVDEMPGGTLRVVDYKTGSSTAYARSAKRAPFNGGRQLQPALYHSAIEALSGRPVSSFEYRFPTERGGNEIVSYAGAELAGARSIIGSLLAHVSTGEFVATTDAADCGFCDYQPICRAGRGRFATTSPRAEWAKRNAPLLPQYASMLERRGAAPAGDDA